MARSVNAYTGDNGKPDHDKPGVRRWYQRECPPVKRYTKRKARGRAREALRTMTDPDDLVIDRNLSTGGWITH